ncbi:TonB-dependent receptor [Lunatimonas salinarum]|uniref:TonB-dependent receptor n=1 Tax=Lunatimonas salinarum TaxID=1774590 RepID=UPI001ADFACA5|nr:TonB-dependent receptor plug domain-containing protein [Lunatimonas salinarum]
MLGFVFGFFVQLFAGIVPVPSDTVTLQQVEVVSVPLDRFAKGQQIISVDGLVLRESRGNTLSELLQRHSGLFVRQYGPGMVGSLTMRGTSAGHNAFFWNGLPINSPSLGQMDLSVIPLSGLDKLEIHFGSSGANYGTDAIGGSVHLTSHPAWKKGWNVEVSGGVGSFGLHRQEFSGGYANSRFQSRTRVYRKAAANRYPYRNLAKPGTPTEKQAHAAILLSGIVQDFRWMLNSRSQLSSSIWWNAADRQIQPLIGSNTRDVQSDQSLRWVLDFNQSTENSHLNVKAGWVRDEMVFNRSEKTVTDQFLVAGELDWSLRSAWEFKSGIRATHLRGDLSTYSTSEQRLEVYHATNYSPVQPLTISLSLRQQIYGEELAPFTPSIGVDWELLKGGEHRVIGKMAASRSYKVPTLNDRFWKPGGNPELRSESALSAEIGALYRYEVTGKKWETRLTYYRMRVDNWIIWMPGAAYWRPENIREVASHGLDFMTSAKYRIKRWELGLTGSWAWTNAIVLQQENATGQEVGRQLPYTPNHKVQFGVNMQWEALGFFINGHWVGPRYISMDNQNALPSYGLLDVGWRYDLPIKQHRISLGFQLYNLMNAAYQVMRLRPMPGRNYELNLIVTL